MTNPGDAHKITITPFNGRVRVLLDGETVAESDAALALNEGPMPVVYYLPAESLAAGRTVESAHTSHCPFKGDASYWHLKRGDGELAENAMWSYRTPLASVSEIAGYVAFYTSRIEGLELVAEQA